MVLPCFSSSGHDSIVGEIRAVYASASVTQDWLYLDGRSFDEVLYPDLFALLGGNVLPDMRGAVLSGINCDNGEQPTIECVGSNGVQVPLPEHTHNIPIKSPTGEVNTIAPSGSYGVVTGGCQTGVAGVPLQDALIDVRGRRLLVNFIIRGR